MSTKEEHVPPESLVYHSNLYTVVICIAHGITFFSIYEPKFGILN